MAGAHHLFSKLNMRDMTWQGHNIHLNKYNEKHDVAGAQHLFPNLKEKT